MSVAGGREEPSRDLTERYTHYDSVIEGFLRGRVTPVLGAGVNLCGRAAAGEGEWLGKHPPSGQELASHLAKIYKYPSSEPADLLRVSQYIYAIRGGSGPLYDTLRELFDRTFPTTPVHDFLAGLPSTLRQRARVRRPPLIVTTNYDDLMERAFRARDEPFDLIVYAAEGPHEGKFCCRQRGGRMESIPDPKSNVELDPDQRSVILKVHGFVDRQNPSDDNDDSYVITEDHYIEYLARIDLDNLIPVKVLRRLRSCHFLFLGYSLSDWNLRAILYKLWSDRRRDRDWWAIQLNPSELERKSWRRRGVDILDIPLEEYLEELSERLQETLGERVWPSS